MQQATIEPPAIIAGGGIGGLAAALAIARTGRAVKVLEQSAQLGEIGAGIQLGPNAFAAFDALGVGEKTRAHAVYTDRMLMFDAIDESEVAQVSVGEQFRQRFGNPYAVIHRADVHNSLLEGVRAMRNIELLTATKIVSYQQMGDTVEVIDDRGVKHLGACLVGCDGVKSVVREQMVGDPVRVSGHVVYRAVVDAADFPDNLNINAPVVWVGPSCHLVHYPMRAGAQFNVVVTFHSRDVETWGVSDGSEAEVRSYFEGIAERPRQLLSLPKSWRRWATADREPIETWSDGNVTLLGDAAHPLLQYLAQGACMALEDAVTLGKALERCQGNYTNAFQLYQKARVARAARVVLMTREMGRIYHAKGVERLVRNQLWQGRSQERYYDALSWLYDWRADNCLPS